MVERGALEKRYGCKVIVGSNPTPSATQTRLIFSRVFDSIKLIVLRLTLIPA